MKTDGPAFSTTLCAVLIQLDEMYTSTITEEHNLISARKKGEKDLAKYGEKKCPERTLIAEAYTNVILAIKDCRVQRRSISDQISKALGYGRQPALIQGRDEEKILALVSDAEEIKENLELWVGASKAAVGADDQAGRVGEPGDRKVDAAPPVMPAAKKEIQSPDGKGGAMIANQTRVEILDSVGKVIASGSFYGYMPADELYQVRIRGKVETFAFANHTVRPVAGEGNGPVPIALDTPVRIFHVATDELKGEGTLEHETEDLFRVRIGGKLKDFGRDFYRVELVTAVDAVPQKLERGAAVRVTNKSSGEVEGDGKLDKWHDEYALVTIAGRQRRFAFDAFAVAASAPGVAGMVKGEIHEAKPAAEKPAKGSKKKPAKV